MKRLKEIRVKRGVSQTVLASLFDLCYRQVINYESGKTPVPSDKLKVICEFLDVRADYLLELSDHEKEPE